MVVQALQHVQERIESWPPERQRQAAELLAELESEGGSDLSDEHHAEVWRLALESSYIGARGRSRRS